MDMSIVNTILSIVLTGVVSYLTWLMQNVNKLKSNYRIAVVALLRNDLKQMHKEYMARGYVTIDEYEEFNELYKVYSGLGGNGTGTRMKNDIDKLEIRR